MARKRYNTHSDQPQHHDGSDAQLFITKITAHDPIESADEFIVDRTAISQHPTPYPI
ncbi:MAG TPA: hypothetical protein VL002_15775 [Candidimonas sp.]|nr:hypothetical protein [Candidimonas sp.]